MSLFKQLSVMIGILSITCFASSAIAQQTTTIDFTGLNYPDGTTITNEFQNEGVIFSADDTGIDPSFPCISLGVQENVVFSGVLNNPYRIQFANVDPVIDVQVSMVEANINDQIHGLYELDAGLNVVQSVTYDDTNGSTFTLQLSNPAGISGLGFCEQPFGNESMTSITFTTAPVTVTAIPTLDSWGLTAMTLLLLILGLTLLVKKGS